jgi:hypothetical protein
MISPHLIRHAKKTTRSFLIVSCRCARCGVPAAVRGISAMETIIDELVSLVNQVDEVRISMELGA